MSAFPPGPGKAPILETQGLFVKGEIYHAVLTESRIILSGGSDNVDRSLYLKEIWRIIPDTDPAGDPVLTLSIPAVGGMVHSLVLHFPLRTFPNAVRLRDLWAAEINRLLQQYVPGARQAGPAVAMFCSRCGNRLVDGSAFCDRCGAEMPRSAGLASFEQGYSRDREKLLQPKPFAPQASSPIHEEKAERTAFLNTRHTLPVQEPRRAAGRTRFGFLIKSPKKTAIVIAIFLIIAIIIAIFFVTGLSGSPGFNISSSGLNGILPGIASEKISTGSGTSGPSAVGETAGYDGSFPAQSQTQAPGDPASVIAEYPSLFNRADSAGIQALLADDIKSQYSLDDLSNELDVAQSIGNSIEKIEIKDRIVEGNSATLIADISWNTAESRVTRTQNLQLVYEDSQWKLNTLILHP